MKNRLFHNTAFLGIAVGERTLTLAEVAPAGKAPAAGGERSAARTDAGTVVRRVAEFTFPISSAAGDETEEAGAALAAFLREREFNASRAVIGFPARWLVAREKELPPSEDEEAAEILRLQADRFSSELGELVIDYAGLADAAVAKNVLLLGIPRRQLDRITAICRRAGLDVRQAMPSTLALGAISDDSKSHGDNLVVNVTSDAVELSITQGDAPRLLRHLAVRGPDLGSKNGSRHSAIASLAGELKRTVAMLPRGSSVNGKAPSGENSGRVLRLWDGVGFGRNDAASLARDIGARLEPLKDLAELGTKLAADESAGSAGGGSTFERFAPAIALALAGTRQTDDQVDFIHPRLAKRPPSRFGKRQQWYIGIGGGIALILLILFTAIQYQQWRLDRVKARIVAIGPKVQAAKATSDRITAARGWYDGRPGMLECFRELTAAFPDESIYLTSFTMRDNRTVQVSGRATDRASIRALSDRLRGNKKFIQVTVPNEKMVGGKSNDVTFSMSFTYAGGIE